VNRLTPDVCILDIGMPNINGNQLAQELSQLPATQNALLVTVTRYGTRHDRQAALSAGFDCYFVKSDVLAAYYRGRTRRVHFDGVAQVSDCHAVIHDGMNNYIH
jgi:CheY-like chemotaxis protein